MKITLHNYEAYLLDLSEGKLSKEDQQELNKFLFEHPHINHPQMENLQFQLTPELEVYPAKENLKKFLFANSPITEKNIHDFCIAYHESLLSDQKIAALNTFLIKHAQYKHDFLQYSKCYLQPETIYRDRKKDLYKNPKKNWYIRNQFNWNVAAGILIILTISLSIIYHSTKATTNTMEVTLKNSEDKRAITNITVDNSKKENIEIKKLPDQKQRTQDNKAIVRSSRVETEVKTLSIQKKEIIPAITPLVAKTNEITISSNDSMALLAINVTPIIKRATIPKSQPHAYVFKESKRNQLTLFKLAKMGISGINRITDSNIQLTKSEDAHGNLSALTIGTENLQVYKTIRN